MGAFKAIGQWLNRNFPWLFDEKMPVWLTLLASVVAAFLTYVLAPTFGRQFQIEDVRSQHLTETTKDLNTEIVKLSQNVRRFRTALAQKNNKEAIKLREDCLDGIVDLQWTLVDIRLILTSGADKQAVDALSNSLEKLRLALDAPVTADYQRRIGLAMDALASSTRDTLDRLYSKTSLRP